MFKIFYSWQSDLPSNKTRSFIKSCIDEAIDLAQDSETIEAVRDEATLGVTGSPDIVATLFSKIDECDYFVADVSLCFTEDGKKQKRSPNPNVMLELGYAAKILTWNRVLCVANTDFGDDFPFDFNHNRRIGYSLISNNRDQEKYRVIKRIFSDIRELRKGPPRTKAGLATHLFGTYDLQQRKVTNVIVPLKIDEQESFVLHNQELLKDSVKLVEQITKFETLDDEQGEQIISSQEHGLKGNGQITADSFIKSEAPVRIDVEVERERIRKWLNTETNDDFFNCGGLKIRIQLLGGHEELIGTDAEKDKYNKLTELFYFLSQLEMRSLFIKTFDGILYIPLAIQNISTVEDTNIRIVVHILEGEIINPSKELIFEELEGLQGHFCRDEDENMGVGIIDELFCPMEDGNIHLDNSFKNASNQPQMSFLPNGLFGLSDKDEQDYEDELKEYIAYSAGSDYYEFTVDSLRPNECIWLNKGILIRDKDKRIKIRYQIHSAHSSGELAGEIIYQKEGAS